MACKDILKELGKSIDALLHRHSLSHDHDTVKVLALFTIIFGDFTKHLLLMSSPSHAHIGRMATIIYGTSAVILMVLSTAEILRDLCMNPCPIRKHKQAWLISVSKVLITLGAIIYLAGSTLPTYTREFSQDLNCDQRCEKRVQMTGGLFLFLALVIFHFVPRLFKKINYAINESYDEFYIRNDERYKTFHTQWFVIRMLSVTLDLDAIYTAVWVYEFIDSGNCDIADIYGSTATILAGWITWTIYALANAYYINGLRLYKKLRWSKILGKGWHCVLNGLFYLTLALFLTTFLPIHILAGNQEPLSCGCASSSNITLTAFMCGERSGVLETRVFMLLYQVVILTALGALGIINYSFKNIKYY